ncbi:uncharacterized protein [Eurosta solidaginis]|uniref:uncharacterized protein isoform X2 n=1 Tax=Eurosta solidaginis TaxID=178769 RepID=UPI0035317CD5
MLLKKYVKNRRKLKILFLLMVIVLIVLTVVILNISPNVSSTERVLDGRFIARIYGNGVAGGAGRLEQPPLKSPRQNGVIMPEKYDEHKVKARIAQERVQQLRQEQRQQQQRNNVEPGEEHTALDTVTTAVHIFYCAPVAWYKTKKSQNLQQRIVPQLQLRGAAKELLNDVSDTVYQTSLQATTTTTVKPVRILNTAFYPALGLYRPTTNLLQKHFDNIRNCGIGVLILSCCSVKADDVELTQQLLSLAPSYNLSITFEISVAGNQSAEYLQQQLEALRRYSTADGFYRVYSLSRKQLVPLVYVSNAYKLSETPAGCALCQTHPKSLRHIFDAYYIGHIRLKNHVDIMKRLCFEGFYNKLPSNGATFASTWKNWSYLKSFALTYKMLFVPTVGPGFAERNKFPRHGDIQRHRSNGRPATITGRMVVKLKKLYQKLDFWIIIRAVKQNI